MNFHPPDRAPLLFCATGVNATLGGIASANRNVLAALKELASDCGHRLHTMTLSEPTEGDGSFRGYGGGKYRFAADLLRRLPACSLAVFDHVRLALPILALPRALRPPVVVCAHGSESWRRIRPSSIRVFRAADLVLTNSEYTLRKMRTRFTGFRGVACPLGLPPQFPISPTPPPPSDLPIGLEAADGVARDLGSRVLLLVGRMDAEEREKGHRELLEVLPALAARFSDVQLVFAGGGSDLPALREAARTSPAANRIFLPGQLPNERIAGLYRKAYAFTMPSRQEGFGLAYLEAMNFAKPCLACRDDGGAEVVVHEETGLLVDQPIRLPELTGALSRLLENRALARQYGEAGWRRLMARFSSAAHQARVVDMIRPLLQRSGQFHRLERTA